MVVHGCGEMNIINDLISEPTMIVEGWEIKGGLLYQFCSDLKRKTMWFGKFGSLGPMGLVNMPTCWHFKV